MPLSGRQDSLADHICLTAGSRQTVQWPPRRGQQAQRYRATSFLYVVGDPLIQGMSRAALNPKAATVKRSVTGCSGSAAARAIMILHAAQSAGWKANGSAGSSGHWNSAGIRQLWVVSNQRLGAAVRRSPRVADPGLFRCAAGKVCKKVWCRRAPDLNASRRSDGRIGHQPIIARRRKDPAPACRCWTAGA